MMNIGDVFTNNIVYDKLVTKLQVTKAVVRIIEGALIRSILI